MNFEACCSFQNERKLMQTRSFFSLWIRTDTYVCKKFLRMSFSSSFMFKTSLRTLRTPNYSSNSILQTSTTHMKITVQAILSFFHHLAMLSAISSSERVSGSGITTIVALLVLEEAPPPPRLVRLAAAAAPRPSPSLSSRPRETRNWSRNWIDSTAKLWVFKLKHKFLYCENYWFLNY